MEIPTANARVVRFGTFELDAASGELRKQGVKVRLSDQPFQILLLLLDRPGAVVTRQEIRARLWSTDTFVDFDVGLNSAIRKLREALGDSAENPRFIETLPRRGYRFIAPVQPETTEDDWDPRTAAIAKPGLAARARWVAAALALVATIGTLLVAYDRRWRGPSTSGRSISTTEHAGIPRGVKPDAYDAYLKGILASGQQNFQGFTTAVVYFERAVASQPDFAAAHAALAQAQLQFLFTGPRSPREVIPKAEAAARRALQLDEAIAQAHGVLGTILQDFYWQWEDGEKEFRRARQLQSGIDASSSILSLIRSSRLDDAIVKAEHAREMDPLSVNAHMNAAVAYRAAGQYDRAFLAIRRALEIAPTQTRGHFQLGITFIVIGRLDEAIVELETAVNSSQTRNPRFEAYLGYAYAVAGRRLDANRVLSGLKSRARQEYVSSFGIALIHDALGEKEAALAALERAYEDRAVEFAQMMQYPPFKTIAADPRYITLMQRIGLIW